jgi:hypothetical protein
MTRNHYDVTRVICPTCGRVTRRTRREDERGAFGVCRRDGTAFVPHPPPYHATRAARAKRELGGSRS